jgi:hypothetical protein
MDTDIVAKMAESAAFYVTPSGTWLRIDYCSTDEGYFHASNEDSGNGHQIFFEEVNFEADEAFYKLTKMEVPT